MKTPEQIAIIAVPVGEGSIVREKRRLLIDLIQQYADACIEASLIKAAENAFGTSVYVGNELKALINKKSITDPSNHVLL